MVRGRKRDMSAPLTRSLILQRDYRARKAKYISDLEIRCQKLQTENNRLSRELKELNSRLQQKEVDRKLGYVSTKTEADLEKLQALKRVISSLRSATTSIEAFQTLTKEDFDDLDRERQLPSPSATSSNHSTNYNSISPRNVQTVHLYSPVSNHSPSPSLIMPNSGHDNIESWSTEFVARGYGTRPPSVDPRSNIFTPEPSVELPSSSSTQPRMVSDPRSLYNLVSSESTTRAFPTGVRQNSPSNPSMSIQDRSNGLSGQMIPYPINGIHPQHIHPLAPYSYERTLSESLRNFV
ncbi:hypothetical protein C8R42DRAFT_675234 [Lentinula raphanica]|nr:hypothetical protein C8R42DRAFT_675234 [Lentinula raphanica]